ncbi:MAG: PEP/pyruvate-binding domain-containing protein [Candidatus Cloacimonadaceae bacterium]|nr:PEP/pyruvate-binding domain-containing protein [Candidatus Cloacimonadaceae bacterium]MDP3114246.1 PEP/pyruvate-binding domain-containing protein [Candidatus Cloacimonadaceae bacterium]
MKMEELNYYYNKFKFGEDIFHQLMQRRVRDILLVSTFYDAFIFEQDGRLSEQIFGEYRQLNLSTAPRITSVPTGTEALEKLKENNYDLVITMMRIGDIGPFQLAKEIKSFKPDLPVLLLLNVASDYIIWENHPEDKKYIDDVFLWNGDTKLFLAMVKNVEDQMNVEFDTANGLVRVILLVEDSIHYYSMFLPSLYSVIMKQTQRLIEEEVSDINKRLRMRIRPKVLLAHDYEEALMLYEKYKNYLLCLISDVRYKINGEVHAQAGIKLIKEIMSKNKDLPIILQSSEDENKEIATELGVNFLNKNSKHLFADLRNFMVYNLGFGNFVFRNSDGEIINEAANIAEFEEKILHVPDDSLIFHSKFNHFSNWLIAHGEVQIAKRIRPMKIDDFASKDEVRQFLHHIFRTVRIDKNRGKIINFDAVSLSEMNQIIRLTEGSLGGKGRGLAFLNALLTTMEFEKKFENVGISLPSTAIIGTNEFDRFVESNSIVEKIHGKTDEEIDSIFIEGKLSEQLVHRLEVFLDQIKYPIAVRSSSLLEDSQAQPLAGVYRTFMLPNNHSDKLHRLRQLMDAIKLVFSSVYLSDARNFLEALNFKAEEEKMAVIIQEVAGCLKGEHYYYPHISGVAQSYNFYPTGHMTHIDGIANIALGLGKSVVEGKLNHRFCPRYPDTEMLPQQEMMRSSQKEYYVLDLSMNDFDLKKGEEITLVKLNLKNAESHGVLRYLASVWDYENYRLTDNLNERGMRVLTFSGVLKYNQFPLARIVRELLEIGEIALGIPVEIEFAVNLDVDPRYNQKPTFYILQIRPLSVNTDAYRIDTENLDKEDLLMYTEHGMGNGVINDLTDIIYLDPNNFDKTMTLPMQEEIERFNEKMARLGKRYILIGPGRWGSRDKFLGIPVRWPQINRAKVILETGLRDFIVEASQGTHFFHNLVAMNVGYFTIPFVSSTDFVDLEWLLARPVTERGNYFVHVEFDHPLIVRMDGKTGVAVIGK